MFAANRLAFGTTPLTNSETVRLSELPLAAAVCVAVFALVGLPCASSAQLPPAPPTPSSRSICDMPQARGTATYNRYCTGGGAAAAPVGPSPEELARRREAKDTKEATDDAEDRGEALYNKSEWADAVKAFQEALDYDPDNDVAIANLRKAQDKLQQAEAALQKAQDLRSAAAKQAVNAQTRALSAASMNNEAASKEARKPFDEADNTKNNGIPVSVGSADGHKDPVVLPARRTPAITKLEQQRTADRKQRTTLEDKLKTLDPKKDSVAISAIKQKESTIDSHVNYLNFSIDDQLKAPSTVPPDNKK
jgi:tetratricopeptide (TPR) repeat protein